MPSPSVATQSKSRSEGLAAHNDVAVFQLAQRTQLEMSGPDRHAFLHNFCTNDIKGLPIGRGCEAFLCNVKGRILGHIFVFAGPESLWIETTPGHVTTLVPHLERYHLLETFTLTDRSAEFGELFVTGPNSPAALGAIGINVGELRNWDCVARIAEESVPVPVSVKRVDWFGATGFLLSASNEECSQVQGRLVANGVCIGSSATFADLRIEAGFPYYGVDLSDENLAQEAMRTNQAISFTKGCYLGQEPIARLNAMGHVNKQLCRVRFECDVVPAAPQRLVNPADPSKEIGLITSIGWSVQDNLPAGLGIVRSAFAQPGTRLQTAGDAPVMARVV